MALNTQPDPINRIIHLRYLIGFLGEKNQCNWWPTSFYEPSSFRFLQPVFSRTTTVAQYHGVVEAARRFHDENLNMGSFHIFRLPEEIEQDLHEMVQARLIDLFDPDLIVDQAAALHALSKVSDKSPHKAFGPVLVGEIDELRTSDNLEKIGAIYRMAMSSETQALPYLVA